MSLAAAILIVCIALPVADRVLPWLWWVAAAPFLAAVWVWDRFSKKPARGVWPNRFEPYQPKNSC